MKLRLNGIHSILNQNSVVEPLARARGAYIEIVNLLMDNGIGIIQLVRRKSSYMTLLVLFLVIIIIKSLSSNSIIKRRGKSGELSARSELLLLDTEKYKIFNDITVVNGNVMTQIDHVVVSIYGIFVIETKNYSGLITGEERSNRWTQHLVKRKVGFRNPIYQNYGHIKVLEETLKLENRMFISIIAFTNKVKLSILSDTHVIHIINLKDVIISYKDEVLSSEEVKKICEELQNIKDKTTSQNIKRHQMFVRRKRREYIESIRVNICPRCKGKLIIRRGKYGAFYGCSNFPKCRFVKSL